MGLSLIQTHPLFGECYRIYERISNRKILGDKTICTISSDGWLMLNEDITLAPEQWAYVIAHNILHLAFGHFDADKMPGYNIVDSSGKQEKKVDCNPLLWNMACDIYVNKFLSDIKFGGSIHSDIVTPLRMIPDDEIKIYEALEELGITGSNNPYGTAAIGTFDMNGLEKPLVYSSKKGQFNHYTKAFSLALAHSVSKAVSEAGGHSVANNQCYSERQKAARWFIDHYPLLGGLASHFRIIEDSQFCNKNDIHIAAIDVSCGEIYLNPAAGLSLEEWKFVLAHEYLHAGLMHQNRCNGRDPYLWNVACDFVINSWLNELQVGVMPPNGLLYDPALKNLSAESIYDRILSDMKSYAKFGTFRGFHKGDILGSGSEKMSSATSYDDFCRSAMQQGLEYHISTNRGLIPAGLIEEIRALAMPPIPWDVALAKWFDVYFQPLEKHRSYARPSRRQASTPDIPRPSYWTGEIPVESRTFGVIVDTSGSMSTTELGKALGAIASYSVAHDVPFARVIFCDANAYDAGYISPEDIAGRICVKGRGGTRLQPGIDELEKAADFPKDGPILIITDGAIENHLDIKHEHAYLLPKGCYLPFHPKGEVFHFEKY